MVFWFLRKWDFAVSILFSYLRTYFGWEDKFDCIKLHLSVSKDGTELLIFIPKHYLSTGFTGKQRVLWLYLYNGNYNNSGSNHYEYNEPRMAFPWLITCKSFTVCRIHYDLVLHVSKPPTNVRRTCIWFMVRLLQWVK